MSMLFSTMDQFTYVDPPHYLKCVICMDVMKQPVSLSCGHSFCSGCCFQSLERKKECPFCRKEMTAATPPHPNISLCQALDEQLVHCRFGPLRKEWIQCWKSQYRIFEIDTQGCTNILKRGDVPTHEKECAYRWTLCGLVDPQTNERCNVVCRKSEQQEHHRVCEFRLVPCVNEGCDEQVCLMSLEWHKERCLFENVKCCNEGCPDFCVRKNLRQHHEQCPYRITQCMFHKYGCTAKGKVGEVEQHMKGCVNEHLMLLCSALDMFNQLQRHPGSNSNSSSSTSLSGAPYTMAGNSGGSGGSSSTTTSAQPQPCCHRHVTCPKKKFRCNIHNFDELAKKQVIDIDLDISWKLKIWPNGEDKRHRGYISIRLFSREACGSFRVEGPYTLRIVNQVDGSRSVVKMTEASSREWADSVRGWGFPAFAKVDDVLEPSSGFVRDNSVVVEVEVLVQAVVEVVEYHHYAHQYAAAAPQPPLPITSPPQAQAQSPNLSLPLARGSQPATGSPVSAISTSATNATTVLLSNTTLPTPSSLEGGYCWDPDSTAASSSTTHILTTTTTTTITSSSNRSSSRSTGRVVSMAEDNDDEEEAEQEQEEEEVIQQQQRMGVE